MKLPALIEIPLHLVTGAMLSIKSAEMVSESHDCILNYWVRFTSNSGQPNEFLAVSNSSTSITFTWKPPHDINGTITNYTIRCSIPGTGVTHILDLEGSQNTTILSGLLPYTDYMCSITAHTSIEIGSPASVTVTTLQDGESSYTVCITCCYYIFIKFQVEHHKNSLSPPHHIRSLSPGLLHFRQNVMESSSAILLPVLLTM